MIPFQNNFTEMLLMMPSTKIAQTVQLSRTNGHLSYNIYAFKLYGLSKHLLICQDSGEQSRATGPSSLKIVAFNHILINA